MNIKVMNKKDLTTIVLSGRNNRASEKTFLRTIISVNECKLKGVIINLEELEGISDLIIESLLSLQTRIITSGGMMAVCGISKLMREELNEKYSERKYGEPLFAYMEDEASALASFGNHNSTGK